MSSWGWTWCAGRVPAHRAGRHSIRVHQSLRLFDGVIFAWAGLFVELSSAGLVTFDRGLGGFSDLFVWLSRDAVSHRGNRML